ncbi:hypothetical protein SNK03_003902 [Fusarium graminearum]|nr:unnamed protein product [Fusarium graminearum]CAG1992155.1 unnamed protein product [Fusarium graminearum]
MEYRHLLMAAASERRGNILARCLLYTLCIASLCAGGFVFWYTYHLRSKAGLDKSNANGNIPSMNRRSMPDTTQESVPTILTFTNTTSCDQGTVAAGETQKFLPLCRFCCAHGYCPQPCICTGYGEESSLPPVTGVQACRIQGTEKANDELCAFACAHGYCPSESCTTGCEFTNGKMNKLEQVQ